MIISEIIKISKPNNFDNLYIENALENLGIVPIRWAIVEINNENISVSVSYETN